MSDADPHASPSPVDDGPGIETVETAAAAHASPKTQNRSHVANGQQSFELYVQPKGSSANYVMVRRVKRNNRSAWRQLARWLVQNQIGLSFNLIALLFLAHGFIPKARAHTRKFFTLSYYNPDSGRYGGGFDDFYAIAFCIVLFTGLRASTMDYVLTPLGRLCGVSNRKDLVRFAEQTWLLCYYMVFWPMGMYLYVNSPYFLDLRELWTDWPTRELGPLMKGYILAQWAYWLQQILVINIEERRKDHWQMFTHHIITTSLLYCCYSYHATGMGNFILIIMDIVDLFLPIAKCLKYAGYTKLCDIAFGVFMTSWIVARHCLYIVACWSIYQNLPHMAGNGCYSGTDANLVGPFETPPGYSYLLEPFTSSSGLVCFNYTVKWSFLAPLLALQLITIVWFTMIVRVAVKVLRGDGAEDSRSDDEGPVEEEEEEEYVFEEAQPLEEEVGVESLDLKGWERRYGVKRQGSSTGVSLPSHSDRKELLGRIGCEKQVE